MSKLRFTKMHGLGNDFVVLDGIAQKIDLSAAQYKALADGRAFPFVRRGQVAPPVRP